MTYQILWCAACGFLGACGVLIVVADVFLLCRADTAIGCVLASIGLLTGAGATLVAGMMWDNQPNESGN